eukprot:TRINITY_DN3738_c0_g1_i12.p2 TRINITY_DN3738_c0_g1~~TRINITY_DN3738_c0_g1_i12.p2  ORF type:complete len:233 (-),score=46.56 TRINITY_DN3738_c0_g1_i12:158-856(-)
MSEAQARWIALESNPLVMNEKATRVVPESAYYRGADVYFLKQVISNACGAIAVTHALANNVKELGVGGKMGEFLQKSKEMTPQERGEALAASEEIASVHKDVGEKGQTDHKEYTKVDYHFVCYTSIGGTLFELDGARPAPISHGPTTRETFTRDAARVIQETFVQVYPGVIDTSLLTLGPAPEDEDSELKAASSRAQRRRPARTWRSLWAWASPRSRRATRCRQAATAFPSP